MNDLIYKIRKEKPLIHHITNEVTTNDLANITLYWGGLPVMANYKEEVEEMVSMSQGLLLNIGILHPDQVEAMIRAGKKANQLNIPVILDPVGVGATKLRTKTAKRILNEIHVSAIKGNQGEIVTLAGEEGNMKGVESIGEYRDIIPLSKKLALNYDTIVVISGKEDIITDGKFVYKVFNGHPFMGNVVGTGCMLGSTLACFLAVSSDPLKGAVYGVTSYCIAGEIAAKGVNGPASYKISFLDTIYNLDDKTVSLKEKIEQVGS
ncbi:hydroxyethylthiazole kinase [Clostridiisalibacter paucivorans]|uniref:hydroxyethylthiazole kinase n=1 Tax=Clostridiisalibacter paucivorans TaxID=408753 RepID=UPI000550AD2C|nr:hydroxyethylthiazole kinase [Clostridiisalibacter paucivorans]